MQYTNKKESTGAIKVLVADDAPVIRSVFQHFSAGELQVSGIVTDRHGLTRAMLQASTPFDAILCSDHLAGWFGGVYALNELRASRILPPETAFILLSGDRRRANLRVDVDARPDSIVLKPFSQEILLQRLGDAVRERKTLLALRKLAQEKEWERLVATADALDVSGPFAHAVQRLKFEALTAMGQGAAVLKQYRTLAEATPRAIVLLEGYAQHAFEQTALAEAEKVVRHLLRIQPVNLLAMDLLAAVLHAKGDPVSSQQTLQQALLMSPHSVERHRLLGHYAVLNGDTVTAHQAYGTAMRQECEAVGYRDDDVINVVRVLMLRGDSFQAARVVAAARKARHWSLVLEVVDHFTDTIRYREYDSFSRTQRRVIEGIEMLDRAIMPYVAEALMAATEACLMACLPHRARDLSEELLSDKMYLQLHPAQKSWVQKLHMWSRTVQNEDLPCGLHHYQRFMS
jgi:CheY-like chemotaxis protein